MSARSLLSSSSMSVDFDSDTSDTLVKNTAQRRISSSSSSSVDSECAITDHIDEGVRQTRRHDHPTNYKQRKVYNKSTGRHGTPCTPESSKTSSDRQMRPSTKAKCTEGARHILEILLQQHNPSQFPQKRKVEKQGAYAPDSQTYVNPPPADELENKDGSYIKARSKGRKGSIQDTFPKDEPNSLFHVESRKRKYSYSFGQQKAGSSPSSDNSSSDTETIGQGINKPFETCSTSLRKHAKLKRKERHPVKGKQMKMKIFSKRREGPKSQPRELLDDMSPSSERASRLGNPGVDRPVSSSLEKDAADTCFKIWDHDQMYGAPLSQAHDFPLSHASQPRELLDGMSLCSERESRPGNPGVGRPVSSSLEKDAADTCFKVDKASKLVRNKSGDKKALIRTKYHENEEDRCDVVDKMKFNHMNFPCDSIGNRTRSTDITKSYNARQPQVAFAPPPQKRLSDIPCLDLRRNNRSATYMSASSSADKDAGDMDGQGGKRKWNTHQIEKALGGGGGVATDKPFHEKTGEEKDHLYEKIADQLAAIGDNYDIGSFPPPTKFPSQWDFSSQSNLVGATAETPIDCKIVKNLKEAGDREARNNMDITPQVVNLILKNASYDKFSRVVDTNIGDEPGWQQIAMVFRLTQSAVGLAGYGTALAGQVTEMTLKYFEDRFASWIIGQGGWESAVIDQTKGQTDPEVD